MSATYESIAPVVVEDQDDAIQVNRNEAYAANIVTERNQAYASNTVTGMNEFYNPVSASGIVNVSNVYESIK